MKTYTFRMWESNRTLLTKIQESLEMDRKQVLSKNLILNEVLKKYMEDMNNG